MQSPRGALTGKFCSYLACWLTGVLFLACCVLPDKKPHGNRLYWCKYIRDINGATQSLKATVQDRRVWLPAPACVIVAVRLSKALKDAHGALKGAKQSPRQCGPLLLKMAPREMKHELKMHVPVCPYVLYHIRILWLYPVPSPRRGGFCWLSPPNKAPSPLPKLKHETLWSVDIFSNFRVSSPPAQTQSTPAGTQSPPIENFLATVLIVPCTALYDIPINVAYKTLSMYFIQVLSFVTLVHITQTATRVGPNYILHSRN